MAASCEATIRFCVKRPRALDGKPLDRSWFTKDADTLIQKLAGYLSTEWGVSRNDHLLVLDNTETMASNPEEVRSLARQIRELSRRVGRVLLTSRRREALEANQVEIKPLTEEESVEFLRARAHVMQRQPILVAGDATLAKYSRNLGCKPLVLEVFVGALGEGGICLLYTSFRFAISVDSTSSLWTTFSLVKHSTLI